MRALQLTAAQRRVLTAFRDLSLADGVPPSHRELADHLGFASTNGIHEHLAALERKGAMARAKRNVARAWRITPAGHAALEGALDGELSVSDLIDVADQRVSEAIGCLDAATVALREVAGTRAGRGRASTRQTLERLAAARELLVRGEELSR